jgi:glycosyltransferase involved in cell wall biosynthesis
MKIGIDAHTLGTRSAGNENYYLQLLRGLATFPSSTDRYIIYFTHANGASMVPTADHFRLKRIWPSSPFIRIPVSFPIEFRLEGLDVFHAQFIIPPFCAVRSVTTIPDILFEPFPEFFSPWERWRSQRLIPWSARRADHIITVSHYSRNEIINRYGIHPDRVTVVYESPREEFRVMNNDECRNQIESKYRISPPFIIYVGRLQARKNILRLVEAFAELSRKGIDEKLVLVGKRDWLADKVLSRADELGLSGKVVCTGYVDWDDLPVFYNAAELFVFPSICEGFGAPVVEAMACGIPVVTSYGSSLEEVADGAAVLADPYSVRSIASAIEILLSDVSLRDSLRKKGLKRAANFTLSKKAAQTLSIYRRVYDCN